jgi:hypothetical protein
MRSSFAILVQHGGASATDAVRCKSGAVRSFSQSVLSPMLGGLRRRNAIRWPYPMWEKPWDRILPSNIYH